MFKRSPPVNCLNMLLSCNAVAFWSPTILALLPYMPLKAKFLAKSCIGIVEVFSVPNKVFKIFKNTLLPVSPFLENKHKIII